MIRVCGAVAILGMLCVLGACDSKREDSNRLVNKALERASQNDFQGAKSQLQLAIQKDNTNAAAYHTRAAILSKEGNPLEAIPDFEKAVELDKGNAAWRHELAGKYWEVYQASAGTPDRDQWLPRIEEQISKAIEINATVGEYYLLRARERWAASSFKGSAQDFRKAIELDPLEVGSYLQLGRLYGLMWKLFYRTELFDLAEQTLATAERFPMTDLSAESQALLPDMSYELGLLYIYRSEVEAEASAKAAFREKAIKRFLAIEEEYRDRPMLKLQLAQIFKLNNEIPKACTAAREALAGISGADAEKATLRNYAVNLEQEVCVTSTGYDPNR